MTVLGTQRASCRAEVAARGLPLCGCDCVDTAPEAGVLSGAECKPAAHGSPGLAHPLLCSSAGPPLSLGCGSPHSATLLLERPSPPPLSPFPLQEPGFLNVQLCIRHLAFCFPMPQHALSNLLPSPQKPPDKHIHAKALVTEDNQRCHPSFPTGEPALGAPPRCQAQGRACGQPRVTARPALPAVLVSLWHQKSLQ